MGKKDPRETSGKLGSWREIRHTIDVQAAFLKEMLAADPRNARTVQARDRRKFPKRSELIPYIARQTGRIIPHRRICPAHNAPAEFIDHMMYEKADVQALAPRSGGKTMQFGFSAGMDAYHKALSTRVLGASGEQSSRVYDEFKYFLNSGFKQRVRGDVLQRKTIFHNGAVVELLMASTKSVRGPHGPRLRLDEIDEMSRTIFNDAMSILQSHEGKRAQLGEASTRHNPYGLMADQVANFKGQQFVWCVFEIMAACASKTECRSCNLRKYCPGWKVMKDGVGYYTLEDAQGQRDRIKDDEVYEADALCLRPRRAGTIYQRLEKPLHMPCNVPWDKKHGVWRVFDYGTTHPTVLGYFQLVKTEGRWQARMIDEMRWVGKAPSVIVKDMIEYEKEIGYIKWIDGTIVPMDAAGFRAELEDQGIDTEMPDQARDDGIGSVRNLLVPDINGTPGLIFDLETCEETFKEMIKYHRNEKGKIVEVEDDGPDMVRYFCHTLPQIKLDRKGVAQSLGSLY